jgi:Spy/CpxP family protein refolding chaperone
MKKTILILLIAIGTKGFAQSIPPVPPTPPTPPEPPQKEKMEAMRIAFLTQKLDLTSEEAEKFWPVYNEFQKKREELHRSRRKEMKSAKENIDSLSEKQVEALVDGEMAFRQKNLDLEKEYHSKFKAVLPIRKVAKLYRAEDMFTHRLLEQISERGKGGHGGRHGMAPHPCSGDEQEGN